MHHAEVEIGDAYLPLLGELPDRFILLEGPRGTGKTRAELCVEMCYALDHPGARILLARSTRTRLTETVLTTLEEQVFPAFGMPIPGNASRAQRHSYDLSNGSSFIALGLDDPQRTTSLEVARIYVSEAIEIPMRQHVEALAGALRQTGMPNRRCTLDTNPGAPAHWVNKVAEPVPKHWRRVDRFEDYQRLLDHAKKPASPGYWKRIVTRHQDNPGYFDAVNWKWRSEGEEYLRTLEMFTGHLRRRWLDGDWVAAEGTVFPEFNEDLHTVKPFRVPPDWPQYVGYDPGYDHPTAILWFAVGPGDTIYIVDEIYQGGRSVAEHGAEVMRRNRVNGPRNVLHYYGDPQHAFSITAQATKPIASQFRDATGISMQPWPRSTDKEAMVNAVRQRLAHRTESGGATFKVFQSCVNTINEFQSWSYKRTAKGELPAGDDAYQDRDNHSMDVVCGVLATNPTHTPQLISVNPGRE